MASGAMSRRVAKITASGTGLPVVLWTSFTAMVLSAAAFTVGSDSSDSEFLMSASATDATQLRAAPLSATRRLRENVRAFMVMILDPVAGCERSMGRGRHRAPRATSALRRKDQG